jgi:nucleoside diphosphate kinase
MMMSGRPTLAVIVQGPNCVNNMRKLAGGVPQYKIEDWRSKFFGYKAMTLPAEAAPGTVRGDCSHADGTLAALLGRPVPNMIHASDSEVSYKDEMRVLAKHGLFRPVIREYNLPAWEVHYGVRLVKLRPKDGKYRMPRWQRIKTG